MMFTGHWGKVMVDLRNRGEVRKLREGLRLRESEYQRSLRTVDYV